MLKKIELPFGYNMLEIGSVMVYTAKIRVKTDLQTVNDFFSLQDRMNGVRAYYGKNGTVIISWTTFNHDMHTQLIRGMNALLAHVMHKRIAYKYGEVVETPVELEW
jgi:hypothetical protein